MVDQNNRRSRKNMTKTLHAERTYSVVVNDLIVAAKNGEIEVVRSLLADNPPASHNRALATAAAWGHVECVQLLLSVADASADSSIALRWAAQFGQEECVRLLLPHSNPKDIESEALYNACEHEYNNCIDMLCPVSDVAAVLDRLKRDYPDNYEKWMYLQQKHEYTVLNKAVHATATLPSFGKKM